MVDVKTLELLAEQMKSDAANLTGLNAAAVRSIAAIIEDAIGAPLMWPSRTAGAQYADQEYSGNPSQRLAFNHGVKWAVERYGPSEVIRLRNLRAGQPRTHE